MEYRLTRGAVGAWRVLGPVPAQGEERPTFPKIEPPPLPETSKEDNDLIFKMQEMKDIASHLPYQPAVEEEEGFERYSDRYRHHFSRHAQLRSWLPPDPEEHFPAELLAATEAATNVSAEEISRVQKHMRQGGPRSGTARALMALARKETRRGGAGADEEGAEQREDSDEGLDEEEDDEDYNDYQAAYGESDMEEEDEDEGAGGGVM